MRLLRLCLILCVEKDASAWQGWGISLYDNEDTGQCVPVRHSIHPPPYNMSLLKTRSLSPDDDNSHDPLLQLVPRGLGLSRQNPNPPEPPDLGAGTRLGHMTDMLSCSGVSRAPDAQIQVHTPATLSARTATDAQGSSVLGPLRLGSLRHPTLSPEGTQEPPTPRSQGSSLHTFQKTVLKKSVLNESPGPLVWAPLQLSPLVRGELEGHMSHKVSTLRAQVVPLPVKKSWEILNHLMDVQGVPEQGLPKTQLPTLLPQRAEQNTNRSPDAPSFHVHVNIGVNSELSRIEVSQPLTSNKQLQSANDHQVLSYNPVVISMGTPAPINIVREENTLLKKDSRHVLELNIDQRVLGLPEKRIQPQRAQVTDVELTAQVSRSAKDSIKVTPMALLQVMGSMGMIPESHAQVIDCVGFPPQPPNQAETVNLTPRPSDQVIEPKTSLQSSATESKSMASRLSPVADNMKVTPAELLRIMDSMGMINELYPHVIEPAEIAPKPQYQVMKSAKVDILHGHQAIRPEDKSLGLQQSVLGTVEVIPQPQHKVMGTPNMTLGPQNQATEHIGIAPGPIHENILEISSSALPKAIDYTKATPVAQQTMDFMQKIPPGEPHITEPRALIQTENLTPLPAQPDVLTSTVPKGAAESRGIPPQLPSTVLASSGQFLHALKVTPIVQAPPGVGMIPPLQVVEPPGLTPQPVAQVKEPLDLPSGFQVQAGDSVGTTPQHQGAECVSLTPGLSQQVMDPSKFTPRHQDLDYSENWPYGIKPQKKEWALTFVIRWKNLLS
ncbi:uncharacterized protein LOC142837828 [Microtus pennsylvanicus]|uniref:uncharacterized protein LOC142837828 n=1 Tax=Microtus pennsylvanicus TaxID=10058 RepID=UPI003F6C0D89